MGLWREVDLHVKKKMQPSQQVVLRDTEGSFITEASVPMGLPSRGGDVAVYVVDIKQLSLPAPFHSVLVSVSVFMALSTVFDSIDSPDNSLLSHSVLLVLFLLYWSFQLYICL